MEAFHRMSKSITQLILNSLSIVDKALFIPKETVFRDGGKFSFYICQKHDSFLQQQLSDTQIKRPHGSLSWSRKTHQNIGFWRNLLCSEYLCCPKKSVANSERHYSTDESKSYLDVKDPKLKEIISRDMIVKTDFLTENEEESLISEVNKYMKRLRYEFDHWDNAIHGYRETEKRNWNEQNMQILERVKGMAFTSNVAPLAYVHVLDIAKDGYIKPHVDAVRFCGDTITGMCLLSSCVMRLALESDSTQYADVYLPRRSLYIMRRRARYEFTHEVLKDEQSYFRDQYVPRDRRISIICRNEPTATPNL